MKAFMKLDGMQGPSTTKGHEGWTELLEFGLGRTPARDVASGGGPPHKEEKCPSSG